MSASRKVFQAARSLRLPALLHRRRSRRRGPHRRARHAHQPGQEDAPHRLRLPQAGIPPRRVGMGSVRRRRPRCSLHDPGPGGSCRGVRVGQLIEWAPMMERTFIAIKPDGVQRGLISEIVSRFERKGYKLVAIKLIVPSKEFAQKHYHDLKERPFFNGLCDFLSSGPVLAMVWEGEGVIKYGRKLIGATDPQKSEPGTIRGDLAVVVGRNIIHGSDGPETAKDEIALWFEPKELVSYTSNAEKWIYGVN